MPVGGMVLARRGMVTYLHMVAGVPAERKGRGPGRSVEGGKIAAAFIGALSGLRCRISFRDTLVGFHRTKPPSELGSAASVDVS